MPIHYALLGVSGMHVNGDQRGIRVRPLHDKGTLLGVSTWAVQWGGGGGGKPRDGRLWLHPFHFDSPAERQEESGFN